MAKKYLICCEVKDLPLNTRKWHHVNRKERVILEVSARIYKQLNSVDRAVVPTYTDRKCTDILNDNDSRWWPAKLVWDIIHKGQLM